MCWFIHQAWIEIIPSIENAEAYRDNIFARLSYYMKKYNVPFERPRKPRATKKLPPNNLGESSFGAKLPKKTLLREPNPNLIPGYSDRGMRKDLNMQMHKHCETTGYQTSYDISWFNPLAAIKGRDDKFFMLMNFRAYLRPLPGERDNKLYHKFRKRIIKVCYEFDLLNDATRNFDLVNLYLEKLNDLDKQCDYNRKLGSKLFVTIEKAKISRLYTIFSF